MKANKKPSIEKPEQPRDRYDGERLQLLDARVVELV